MPTTALAPAMVAGCSPRPEPLSLSVGVGGALAAPFFLPLAKRRWYTPLRNTTPQVPSASFGLDLNQAAAHTVH
jgi:hypothetical protein